MEVEKKKKKVSTKTDKKDKPKKEGKRKKAKKEVGEAASSATSAKPTAADKGAKVIEAADKWLKSSKNSTGIKFVKQDKGEHKLIFKFAEEDMSFDVTYPLDADDVWLVTSEELEDKWTSNVSDACMGASGIEEILKIATAEFTALSDEEFSDGDDDEDEEPEDYDDDGFNFVDTKAKEKKEPSSAPTIDTTQFIIPQGYEAGAIQAIAQQLGIIMKMPASEKEFEAGPIDGNITQWEVKLWGIPTDDDLYKDMKRAGVDAITLHVTFPPDFPFSPPFLRVIRPRFAFRTGHVTIGGAICTFLLSNEGWNPLYRLPQVLVDVRAMFTAGKGRLDTGNRSDYTEYEAMDAFRRLLATHGWTHWKK